MSIEIKGRLEIFAGNIILIPGMEPVSTMTSLALAANAPRGESYIDLQDAMEAIKAVTGVYPNVIKVLQNPGFPATGKFLELPSGPSNPYGCTGPCDVVDWYKILRDNAQPINFDELADDDPRKLCMGFNFSGCRSHPGDDVDPLGERYNPIDEVGNMYRQPDPEIRPNQDPIGAYR